MKLSCFQIFFFYVQLNLYTICHNFPALKLDLRKASLFGVLNYAHGLFSCNKVIPSYFIDNFVISFL